MPSSPSNATVATPARGRLTRGPVALFDWLDRAWESPRVERVIGSLLVAAFLGTLAVVELDRLVRLPDAVRALVPGSHFAAVGLAFTLLLVVETLSLVFSLARSVADSVGKQFELLSLILLRKSFLAFAAVTKPVEWEHVSSIMPGMLVDMTGALVVFVATGYYYRVQRHRPITGGDVEQASFVVAKKLVALGLLATFVALALRLVTSPGATTSVHGFFATFYTTLIFSDVLLVLVALRYSHSYHVVFRNSGFAASTLIVRLALTAPEYVNAALGVGAALFGIAVSLAYNFYAPPATVVRTTVIGSIRDDAPPRH
jgi:hypothetical protein